LVDPAQIKTASAAVELYNFATTNFAIMLGGTSVVPNYVLSTGIFTDEFERHNGMYTLGTGLDERTNISQIASGTGTVGQAVYTALQQARVEASQAREGLALYAPNAPKAWQGQMYSLEAYTLVYLGEYFCSGIPVTRVGVDGSITYLPGATTQELFQQAVALFDSAAALSVDSARILNLAYVGKGRALLDLGEFDSAAAAVHQVPTTFAYSAEYSTSVTGGANFLGNLQTPGGTPAGFAVVVITTDREGTNGLRWSIDSATGPTTPDPRIALLQNSGLTFTIKYSNGVTTPSALLRIADGIEARLIEAEADLKDGGSNWLGILNTLRTTCTTASGCAPVQNITSTTFATLTDPVTPDARLNLVMSERARWLFATGHRQGDLRRLLRVYGRTQENVYPTGAYVNPTITGNFFYGTDVVMIPPVSEQQITPGYTGCYNTDP
jgi:hypothetical protein